ncbi:MAG: hypothetical protein DRP65_09200 [Planctomycetota bacterium]|nr:MAG: hypothetical protein DRP65_09200 [Planctomycetota bacterium]
MSTVYDQNIAADTTTGFFGDAGDRLTFQTFTPSVSYDAVSVSLKMYKPGTGTIGDITLSLRMVDGDSKPTGGDLISGTTPGDTLTTDNSGEWRQITFSAAYELTAGVEYAIVARADECDESKNVVCRATSENAYTNGKGGYSTDGGSSWTVYSQTDLLFRVYGDAIIAPPSTSQYYTKRIVAIGSDEVWYGVDETPTQLADSIGQLDTTDFISMFEAYGKAFIFNNARLRIVDFVNVKLTTADIGSNPPDFHTILTGGTSGAKMVVDYITALSSASTIYGKRTTEDTFVSGETVTGTDDGGNAISFVISADEVAGPHWYDYTVYGGDAVYGALPDQATLGCNWRGRIILSGDKDYPHQWYMSRQRNPWDFNYIANDAGSPIAGGNGEMGEVGDVVVAVIAYSRDYLIFGCANSLWVMAGDPAENGSLYEFYSTGGILSADSWCRDKNRNLYILSTVGLLRIAPNFQSIENLTESSYPEFVDGLAYNGASHKLLMGYDRKRHGIQIIRTTLVSGANSCWWYDLRTEGLFPDSYPDACGAFSLFDYEAVDPTYQGLLYGCNDGYIRYADDDAKDDDAGDSDVAIDSYITFGPLKLGKEGQESTITSIIGITTGGGSGGTIADSNALTYSAWTALSADSIVEKLAANTTPNAAGTIAAPGRNRGARKRKPIRGLYAGIRIGNDTAAQTWGLEKLIVESRMKGRVK